VTNDIPSEMEILALKIWSSSSKMLDVPSKIVIQPSIQRI
jgi:hypothetical protein